MRSPRSFGRCARGKSASTVSDRMVVPGIISELSMSFRTTVLKTAIADDCLCLSLSCLARASALIAPPTR